MGDIARKPDHPPFQWRVPGTERESKDHMTENYQRMKKIAAEGQKKRHAPLKAQFHPGRKNERYAHVQSRYGKNGGQLLPSQKSFSEDLANRRVQQGQKFMLANGNGQQVNGFGGQSRLSKSSMDIRSQSQMSGGGGHPGYLTQRSQPSANGLRNQMSNMAEAHVSGSHPEFRILHPNNPDDSVYKWRLNEPPVPSSAGREGGGDGSAQCHRVEYLPCDGICADETVINHKSLDSGRSNSSRTSRGCNTEETRIFPETKQQLRQQQHEAFQCRGLTLGGPLHGGNVGNGALSREELRSVELHDPAYAGAPRMPTANKNANMNMQARSECDRNRKVSERSFFPYDGDGDLEGKMKNLNVRARQSSSKVNGINGTSGELPHTLGSVPKYLTQRKEEWRKEAEAEKEAQQTAHIPPGYFLMTEEERIGNLQQFRKSYDMLIAELNRVPIHIDTVRVRNQKIDLEKRLTGLEEAMKTFSRPKVWVKQDG